MQPGRLDRQITIQAKTVVRGTGGSFSQSWTDEAVTWATKIDQGGREFRAAGTVLSETTTIWTIRYRADLTTFKRIKYGSLVYQILAVSEIGRRTWQAVQTKYLGEQSSSGDALQTFSGEELNTFSGDKITPINT